MGLKLNATTGGGSVELDVPNSVGSDFSVTVPAMSGEFAVKDSSGNLGVGTQSPTHILDVQEDGGGSAARLRLFNTGTAANDDVILMLETGANDNESMIWFGDAADNNVGQIRYDHDDNSMQFHTNASLAMNIDGSGKVQINTTSTEGGHPLSIAGDDLTQLVCRRNNANGGCISFKRDNSFVGSVTVTTTATSFNTSSDYRLKENVVNLENGITRVKQLAPKRFNFINEPGIIVDGFLAHEAQTVVPEAVTGEHNEVDSDGNAVMQQIDQAKLVPLLTAALQESITRIETLEAKVAALEAAE